MPYYFSYGSNMLTERLCAPDRIPGAKLMGVGLITGRRLTFHKVSSRKIGQKSGKCDITIDPSPSSEVYGVVFEVPDLDALDEVEGVGRGYSRTPVWVHSFRFPCLEAQTYTADATDASVKPYDWYWSLVLAGAEQHGLPQHYIETYIRSVKPVEDPGGDKYRDCRNGCAILSKLERLRAGE